MRRFIYLFVWAAAAFAQPAQTDSQVLQSILAEIRQLRHDIQATSIAAQRLQIVLYRVQVQSTLVAAAGQRLDDARGRLGEIQAARRNLALQIQQGEDAQKSLPDSDVRKRMDDQLIPLRANLEAMGAEEEQRQARMTEAEGVLRNEEAKIVELQAQVDKLDSILDALSRK